MSDPLKIHIVTIFPQMLEGFLRESMMKRAVEKGAVRFEMVNPRDFTTDRHRTTDDRPYGGGPGMVMLAEPLFDAVESIGAADADVILLSPQGRPFEQRIARELSVRKSLIFVCGHYEGIDERVREELVTDEISIGDYVLTNGTLAAGVVIDAVVRLLPGVLGGEGATDSESFEDGLLEHPHYTRPSVFRGMTVPDVLMGGDHQKIAEWRHEQACARTVARRPDLVDTHTDTEEEQRTRR